MDFACKQIKFQELIKCSFGMNKTDYNLLIFLLKNKEYLTVMEISKLTKLDRTTIQKSMKRLHEKDLVVKHQDNLDKGGYIYSYIIKDKKYIKNMMHKIIDTWVNSVTHEISKW